MVSQSRAVIFRKPLYTALIREVVSQYGSGGEALLYLIGKYMGESGYENHVDILGEERPHVLIKIAEVFFRMVGFGIAKVIDVDLNEKRAKVIVHDCFECELYKNTKEPVSHLVRGILAGWFEKLFKSKVQAIDTKCIAKNDEYCEFLIEISK